ncbi:Cyclin-D2-2, partial [Ananas comosus]
MGIRYGFASSSLLCSEENNNTLCFDADEEDDLITNQRSGFYSDFYVTFPPQSEECVALLVEREPQLLPMEGYFKRLEIGAFEASVRRDAIDWILKVHLVHCHYNFGPLSAYLSVNYLDRFLSNYEFPQDKAWMTQLLSVACLSLAVKMEETEIPLPLDLQVGEAKYVFEPKTIQRMELLVLSTLKWRMQAVTPFSFLDHFLTKFIGKTPANTLILQSVDLILSTLKGIEFLQFKPSEVAAAAALAAVEDSQILDISNALSGIHVDKERVLACHELIQEVILVKKKRGNGTVPLISSVPQSPI